MKKKLPISLILLVILVISLVFNVMNLVRNHQSYKQSTQMLSSHLYSSLQSSVRNLDDFLADSTNNKKQLEGAGIDLIKVDTIVFENSSYYKNPLYYPGILSFSYIADNLIHFNQSILNGTPLTDKELTYVKTLHDDLNSLVSEMSDMMKNNAIKGLSMEQLNYVIGKFYDKWSNPDTNPYRLVIN